MKNIMKKMNKKGFTLAELLIVVAIIAVLVAISIPIFNSQLEKSREAVDLANVRAAYAEISVAALTEGEAPANTANVTYTFDKSTPGSETYKAEVKLTQKQAGWQTADADTAVAGITATGSPTAKGKATVTIHADGSATTVVYE